MKIKPSPVLPATATVTRRARNPLVLACLMACTAALGLGAMSPVQAQVSVSINLDGNIASQEWADPPGRVGRLSYLSGDVSFFGDNQEGWTRGRLNYPVSNENSVWTGRAGRAEFRVGAQAVRVDEETVVDVLNLTDNATVLYLQRGAVNLRVRDFSRSDSFWIDTAEGRLAIRGNGRFRVEVDNETGETRFTVFSGSARVEGDGVQRGLERGTTLRVRGGGNIADSRYERSVETGFDRWSANRDRDDDYAYSSVVRDRVVSSYMTGYEDLNNHGDWIDDNEYGRIWAPRLTVSTWAPYRYGRWTYARRWGWTWVDDAPWGFAPFHYGRWLFTSNRWCWSPGSYVQRPVYAPALVGWHGNFSYGGQQGDRRDPFSNALNGRGAIGWFPLSPNDRFSPSYTSNQNYVRNVNAGWAGRAGRPNGSNNVYQNQAPGATFVARDTFLNAAPITSQATISAADVMRGGVSLGGTNNTFTTAAPTLLPGRFRGNNPANQPRDQFANPTGGTGAVGNPVNVGRPNASVQPQVQPQIQPQLQPQIQPQFQPQVQQPGRPSAADVMRGGVSAAPAPAAPAYNPAPTLGGRPQGQPQPQPQPQIQPQLQPQQPRPMPMPGRGEVGNQGIGGGRPLGAQQAEQAPVVQPSAPVYSRPGYAAPAVAPNTNVEAPTGFRRGTYGEKQQNFIAPAKRPHGEPAAPKVETRDEAKVETKHEGKQESKRNDNRQPVRGQAEKQQ